MSVVVIGLLVGFVVTLLILWAVRTLGAAQATLSAFREAEAARKANAPIPIIAQSEESWRREFGRTAALAGVDTARKCSTCAKFDLEEGQAMAKRYGAFMTAAVHVSPAEMGAVHTPEGEEVARDIPAAAKWTDFGLCEPRVEGIWGKTDAARRERMQGPDGVEGGFLVDGVDCYEPRG